MQAGMWEDLGKILGDLQFIQRKCLCGQAYTLVNDYLALDSVSIPFNWSYKKIVEKLRYFVLSNTYILANYPKLIYQQAASQPDQGMKFLRNFLTP